MCIAAGVLTIDQLINLLAEQVLLHNNSSSSTTTSTSTTTTPSPSSTTTTSTTTPHHHYIQEVLPLFPDLQYGMDVNPKFCHGPTGMEYTLQINTFDVLHV